jgi:hypothetical protein
MRTTIRTAHSTRVQQIPPSIHLVSSASIAPAFAQTESDRCLDHDQQSSSPPSHSPENEPPEFLSHPRDLSDDEEADYSKSQSQSHLQKKGAYDSRIQQLLYENPELEIIIADAGKSSDGGFIVYRIRTGVRLGWSRRELWLTGLEHRSAAAVL